MYLRKFLVLTKYLRQVAELQGMAISHNGIEFHQKHAESIDLDEYLWVLKKFMRKFHRSLEKSTVSTHKLFFETKLWRGKGLTSFFKSLPFINVTESSTCNLRCDCDPTTKDEDPDLDRFFRENHRVLEINMSGQK